MIPSQIVATLIDDFDKLWDEFDRADNQNEPPPRKSTAQLLDEMRRGIARLHEEAAAREQERVQREMNDLVKHPDAPHPNPVWRERSRKVYRRMREHLYCENAPWHHREIWEWAASSSTGIDWIEHEIEYWERRTSNAIERKRLRLERDKRRRIAGEPVDILDVDV